MFITRLGEQALSLLTDKICGHHYQKLKPVTPDYQSTQMTLKNGRKFTDVKYLSFFFQNDKTETSNLNTTSKLLKIVLQLYIYISNHIYMS